LITRNSVSTEQLTEGVEFEKFSNTFRTLTGFDAKVFSFPGLRKRDLSGNLSILATMHNNEKVMMTYRGNSHLAKLEALVLKNLSECGASVPRLLNQSGNWLIQEYLGDARLSQSLNIDDEKLKLNLLEDGLSSLQENQNIALQIGLNDLVLPICNNDAWRNERVRYLDELGRVTKIPSPKINKEKVFNLLKVKPLSFIKWDARPGNAIVRENKNVFWFDWEHCGLRAGIDDLVWFLCDEWISCNENTETLLIDKFVQHFDRNELNVPRLKYVYVHGTVHMCGKLLKIIQKKVETNWWSRDFCLKFEQMGITLNEAKKLARKASRWARNDQLTAPLSNWLIDVEDIIERI